MTSNDIIRLLQLEPHPTEGGYFRRTYESDLRIDCGNGGRPLLTSIYYLLMQDSPSGFLHRNKSVCLDQRGGRAGRRHGSSCGAVGAGPN